MDTRIEQFQVTLPEGSPSQKIDTALQPITDRMNQTPLRVNARTWMENTRLQEAEVERLTGICRQTCGSPKFRPNASADCIAEFKKLGIELTRETPKGGIQCDKEVLESIQDRHPLVGQVMDARNAMAILSQLKKWKEFADAGLVQCVWDQNGTPMGRYTSQGPNLQNRVVPIRETIESQEGWSFLSMDLGAAEYVTWAALSGDPEMSRCFKEGQDVHQMMGEAVLAANPTLDLHGETVRQFGKTINFAILYKMRPATLAQKLGVTFETAVEIQEAYFVKAAVAHQYEIDYLDTARETGQTTTKFGRRRDMPILYLGKRGELADAEKTAWHHHICGTTAEVLKLKTIKTMVVLSKAGFGSDVVVCVNLHDEVILGVRDSVMGQVQPLAVEAFTKAGSELPWYLPYSVTVKVGKSWKEVSK